MGQFVFWPLIVFTSWTRIEIIKLNVRGTFLNLYALLLSLSLALLIYISLNIYIYLTQNGKHEKFNYHSGITLQSTKNKENFNFIKSEMLFSTQITNYKPILLTWSCLLLPNVQRLPRPRVNDKPNRYGSPEQVQEPTSVQRNPQKSTKGPMNGYKSPVVGAKGYKWKRPTKELKNGCKRNPWVGIKKMHGTKTSSSLQEGVSIPEKRGMNVIYISQPKV